ncbi:MAG: hypothetical protein JNM93_09650 [Bacteriovoracaceae bacterium]|nr:hypothetical protein [Bacteriovoracaceae bacterium]
MWFIFNTFKKYLNGILVISFLAACSVSTDKLGNSVDNMTVGMVSGDGQFAPLNSTFTSPIVVQVVKPVGYPGSIEGLPVFFTFDAISIAGTFSSSIAYTDANGFAQVTVSSLNQPGVMQITASLPLANGDITTNFTLFVSGNAEDWEIIPSTLTPVAGVPFTLTIRALLNTSLPDPDFDGPKDLIFTTTAGNSPDGTPITLPANGLYNFTDGVIDTPLTVIFHDSSESALNTFTISIDGSGLGLTVSSPIQVMDDAVTEVRVVDSNSCAANAIGNINYQVPAPQILYSYYYDQWGNCVSSANVDWTTSFLATQATIDPPTTGQPSVIYTPIQAGTTGTVSITDGTFSDSTGTITNVTGTAAYFVIIGLNSLGNYTINPGVNSIAQVEARDIFGNLASSYSGTHSLTWTTNATAPNAPAALGLPANLPVTPTNGNYQFINGVLTSPNPLFRPYDSNETPTLTVYDGASCGTSVCGTTTPITVNDAALTYALVRSSANGLGGDPATFNAPALTPNADQSFALYCATYDTYGNYLQDDATADWGVAGVITAPDISPGLVNQSNVTYAARVAGIGSVYCDVDGVVNGLGIADSTGNFNVVPGAPKSFRINGGTGEGLPFTVTAGNIWSATVRTYDLDNNLCTNYTNAAHAVTTSYLGSTAVFPAYPSEITPTHTSALIDNTATNSKSMSLNIVGGVATLSNMKLINDTENLDEPTLIVQDNAAVLTSGVSGIISVNQNILSQISIRTAANNAGIMASGLATTTDTPINLFSAGYDSSGNYIGDQNTDWTFVAPSGNCSVGDISGNPVPVTNTVGIIYDPDLVGNCNITARHGSGVLDNTGNITATNGVKNNFEVKLAGSVTTVGAGDFLTVVVTARDADGNRVTNYTPVTTYSFTTSAVNSPEGVAPIVPGLVAGDFALGQAIIPLLQVFNTAATFTMTATETVGGTTTGTSVPITVTPKTLDHYATLTPTGPYVADGASPFSVTVQSRDQYGNPTTLGIGANINLTPVWLADEPVVGTIGGGTGLTFGPGSSKVMSGLTYRVGHQVAIVATDTGTKTTPVAYRTPITFTPVAATINNYQLTSFSTTTPTAGGAFNGRFVAKDIAGNTITGIDALMGTYNFSVTSGATASAYGNTPTHHSGTIPFTAGTSNTVNFTFYNEQTVTAASFVVNDGAGHTGTSTNDINVQENILNHYNNVTSTPFPIDADGIDTFQAVVTARDLYGNIVTGDASINLGVNHISPVVIPGNLGGSTTTINMTSGTTTINNLTYDVVGTMELTATGGATVPMTAARSVDYIFGTVPGNIDHYQITFTGPPAGGPATAGTPFTFTITAKDAVNNTVTTEDAVLNGRNFTWGGLNVSPEGMNPSPLTAQTYAFTAGVATASVTFTKAEVLAIGALTVTDNIGIVGANTAPFTIQANTATHIVFLGANSGTADATTTYSVTIESRDAYGNLRATGNAADSNLTIRAERVTGVANVDTFGGTITGVNLQASASVTRSNLTYQVAHTTRFDFTTAPSITINDTLSTTVTWAMNQATVASYTLEPATPGSINAGVPTNILLTAFDGGGNIILAEDAVLGTLNFNFTTSADCDAPLGAPWIAANNDPANGTKTFVNGVATLPYTFFNIAATCGTAGDIQVTDTTNAIGPVSNTTIFTVLPGVAHHFGTVAAGFGPVPQANNTRQNTTQVTVTLYDEYGNPKNDSTINGNILTFDKTAGALNNGTLFACEPADGDGCLDGDRKSITNVILDFTGTATQTIYDFSYTVGHTIELFATSGAVLTASADSADLPWQIVATTINSYSISRTAPSVTAGVPIAWTVTAYDAAANPLTGAVAEAVLEGLQHRVIDNSGTFALNGPETGTFSSPFANLDWNPATGTATVNLTFYHATNDVQVGYLRFEDNQGVPITAANIIGNNMDVLPAAANHFHTYATGFAAVNADTARNNGTDVRIDLQDAYGNLTTGPAAVQVQPRFVAAPLFAAGDGVNVGTLTASTTDGGGVVNVTTMSLNFSATSQITLYDFGYNVMHTMELRAWAGAVDTAAADSANINWNLVATNVASYRLEPLSPTGTAGTPTDWVVRAFDPALNPMSGATNKAFLDSPGVLYSIVNLAGTNMNGPEAGVVSLPNLASLNFNAAFGTAQFTGADRPIFYNKANDVQAGYLRLTNNQNAFVYTITAAEAMTINNAAGNHFHITQAGFPANASNTPITTTSITVALQDVYGNPATDGSIAGNLLTFVRAQGYGASLGTMTGCPPTAGDGCLAGARQNITAMSLDFNASTTQVIHDLQYSVAHNTRITATQGAVTTAVGDNVEQEWNPVAATIASCTLTVDTTVHPTSTELAGNPMTWRIVVRDLAGNDMVDGLPTSDNRTFLNTQNFRIRNVTAIGNFNGPESGASNLATTANTLGSALNSGSGFDGLTGSASLTGAQRPIAYSDTYNIPLNSIRVQINGTNFCNNSTTMAIDPNISNHFHTDATAGFPATATAAGTAQLATQVNVRLHDLYGNLRSDPAITAASVSFAKVSGYSTVNGTLQGCGPGQGGNACGVARANIPGMTLDFSAANTVSIYDLNYNVADTIEVIVTNGGVTTSALQAADLAWNPTTATINSYTVARSSAATQVAGTATSWTLTALDGAGNAMSGAANKTMLDAVSFNVTDRSNAGAGGFLNGPESGTFSYTAGPLVWVSGSGTAPVSVTAYNAANDIIAGDLRFTGAAISVDNTDTVDITYAAANHFHTTSAGFTGTDTANGAAKTATSVQIDLQDIYGNASRTATAVTLAPVYLAAPLFAAGHGTNLGTLTAATSDGGGTANVTGINLDFNAASSYTLYDLGYNVSHNIELRATAGAILTATAAASDLVWTVPSPVNVASYTMTPNLATGTAGTATNWTVRAFDPAGNIMSGANNAAGLNALTYTYSDISNGGAGGFMNAPNATQTVKVAGSNLLPGGTTATTTWSAVTGTAPIQFTFYNVANDVQASYLRVSDGTISYNNAGANIMTINGAAGDHFEFSGLAGFAANASGTRQNATAVTVSLYDTYQNLTTDAAVTAATLGFTRLSGYTNTGTLQAATTDGGGLANIPGITLNFAAASQRTLYDFSYKVKQDIELTASHASVTNGTTVPATLSWNLVAQTVNSYAFNWTTASPANVGDLLAAELTAYDGGGNIISDVGDQATLNSISFSHLVNASLNAPLGAAAQAPCGNTGCTQSYTFTAGVAPVASYQFFNDGAVNTTWVRVTDTTNSINRDIQNAMTLNPIVTNRIIFANPPESITGTAQNVTMQAQDVYGNLDVNYAGTITVDATGSATVDAVPSSNSVTFAGGNATFSINDAVRETVTMSLSSCGVIPDCTDTEDIIFTGPAHTLVYLTSPVANVVVNTNFSTTPTVEVRDSTGTRVWADAATNITLTAFSGAGCAGAPLGSLANNTGTVTAGQRAFPTLRHSAGEAIYIRASGATVDACAGPTTVYDALVTTSIPASVIQNTVSRIEVQGGVPPLTGSIFVNNSGASLSAAAGYTGGLCPANRRCWDYTAGLTQGTTDTFRVTDSGASMDNDNININGVDLANTGDPVAYGPQTIDTAQNYFITNNGNIASGILNVSWTNNAMWTKTFDSCNGASIAGGGGTCQITIQFNAGTGGGGSGAYGPEVLTVTGATDGSITLNLTGSIP